LNETQEQAEFHFAFKMTEDESNLFRRLLTRNVRRFMDRRVTIGIGLASFAAVIIPVLIAYDHDLLSLSAVLLSELSFAIGYLGLFVASIFGSRSMFRNLFKSTRGDQVPFDCRFDATSVSVKKGTLESRMPWNEISAVHDAGAIVAFWYNPAQGFLIPGRAFKDEAARISFVGWAAERVRAAGPPDGVAVPA
jgi:hypothetical protein